ncbi:MAG: type II toxin-antitoxin system RelE/ParE family toxin [Bacteroidota bacterium]|nr:type II toxin-antitoxin system RelE/ParE family toxin [Bacteroidota bacterium]
MNKINGLAEDKVIYRKDPYKKNNDGNYLYFEILKYRVVYYTEPDEIFIIRIRHTSMGPKEY